MKFWKLLMKTLMLSVLWIRTPLGRMLPEPEFSAIVGTSITVTLLAETVKFVVQPFKGMLTVPLVALG